jgi:pimeloyl-ACP methyl ester carboxylesterase
VSTDGAAAGARAWTARSRPAPPFRSSDARFVESRDGTRIGYHTVGHGPGLVLVQGAMGTAQNFVQLAGALASDFRIHVPDRRGRGLSALPFTEAHSIQRDVDDIASLLRETGARFVFGLSSGAIITLAALTALPEIQRAVLYEPPLYPGPAPAEAIARFNEEIERGQLDAAMVTMMGVVGLGPGVLAVTPRPLLRLASKAVLALDRRRVRGPYAPLHELLPAMRFDFRAVQQMAGQLGALASVTTDVLLLGGSKSPRYLRDALVALEQALPRRRRLELAGLDHSAPWNLDRGGRPEVVAKAIRELLG